MLHALVALLLMAPTVAAPDATVVGAQGTVRIVASDGRDCRAPMALEFAASSDRFVLAQAFGPGDAEGGCLPWAANYSWVFSSEYRRVDLAEGCYVLEPDTLERSGDTFTIRMRWACRGGAVAMRVVLMVGASSVDYDFVGGGDEMTGWHVAGTLDRRT